MNDYSDRPWEDPKQYLLAKKTWKTLSPFQQRCFYLRYIERLYEPTIAKMLNIREKVAFHHRKKARKKIRVHFETVGDFLRVVAHFYPMIVLADEAIAGMISRNTRFHDGRTFQSRNKKSITIKTLGF